jgi:hypothetical protein
MEKYLCQFMECSKNAKERRSKMMTVLAKVEPVANVVLAAMPMVILEVEMVVIMVTVELGVEELLLVDRNLLEE